MANSQGGKKINFLIKKKTKLVWRLVSIVQAIREGRSWTQEVKTSISNIKTLCLKERKDQGRERQEWRKTKEKTKNSRWQTVPSKSTQPGTSACTFFSHAVFVSWEFFIISLERDAGLPGQPFGSVMVSHFVLQSGHAWSFYAPASGLVTHRRRQMGESRCHCHHHPHFDLLRKKSEQTRDPCLAKDRPVKEPSLPEWQERTVNCVDSDGREERALCCGLDCHLFPGFLDVEMRFFSQGLKMKLSPIGSSYSYSSFHHVK